MKILSSSVSNNSDEFALSLQNLLDKEEIRTMLIISSSISTRVKQIFKKKSGRLSKLKIFHIHVSNGESQKKHNDTRFKYYSFENSSFQSFSTSLNNCIARVKHENDVIFFDLVLLDNSAVKNVAGLSELKDVNFIVFENTNTITNYRNKQRLISDRYTLLSQNPSYLTGYAIFKKQKSGHLATLLEFE